ncbi:TolC family protein [Silvibacterium sp.]|uniref:TolC family protein n=1 Tax=Silvibacterium sp. TaxID=1964179 RepID=UPI0039E2C4A2
MKPRDAFVFLVSTLGLSISMALGQSSAASGDQNQAMPCMEGMVMPGCTPTDQQPPKESQQAPSQMQTSMPAPELLKQVVGRPAMGLEDFLKLGDANNPTLKQAKEQVELTQQQARQAALYPNPSIGYEGDQIRGGSYGGGEQGGFVQQTIILGGKLGLRRDIYQQQQKTDQIGIAEQTYRVHGDIEQAFYDALTAQEAVRIRQQLLGIALDAVQTVHQLANVGQADEPDILQTEVEAEQAKVDYAKAQRNYLQAFQILAATSGRPEVPICPLQGDLEKTPDLNAVQMVEAIVANSPTIKRSQQEVAVAEARLKDAKRETIPDLQLRAGEQYNGEQVSTNPMKPVGAQSFASAGIDLPLWNRNQGNVGAATVDVERARQDVLREQLALRQQAAPFAQSFESARFEADRYKKELLPRADKAYRLYLQKYQEMAQAYPQVLVSQRTFFQLRMAYLMALHDVWRSAVALQNFTLSGGLGVPAPSGTAGTIPSPHGTGEGQE